MVLLYQHWGNNPFKPEAKQPVHTVYLFYIVLKSYKLPTWITVNIFLHFRKEYNVSDGTNSNVKFLVLFAPINK